MPERYSQLTDSRLGLAHVSYLYFQLWETKKKKRATQKWQGAQLHGV